MQQPTTDSLTATTTTTLLKKRKSEELDLESALREKHEMEKHALILASLCSIGIPVEDGSIPPTSPSTASAGSASGDDHPGLPEDEDSSSEDSPGKRGKNDTKKRIRTTPEQLRLLEKTYEQEKIPSQTLREELAQKLGMTPRRVQVWFQNKRAKERRMRKSLRQPATHEYHFIPAAVGYSAKVTGYPVNIHTYPRQQEPVTPLNYPTSYHHLYDLQHMYAVAKSTAPPALYPSTIYQHVSEHNGGNNTLHSVDWKKLPPLRYVYPDREV